MHSFHIQGEQVSHVWNKRTPPALSVSPGATVRLEITNASGGQLDRTSPPEALSKMDLAGINPITGPIFVEGAEPGDALVVDILSIDLDDWGWTANIPGFGLLADLFKVPNLRISEVDRHYAHLFPGLRIPVVPFIGVIGCAPDLEGDQSIVPPRCVGGNMDIRHMTEGARLWLPVAVKGGLLSVGDTHAAQGDGEVCGTAVEVSSEVTLRIGLEKGRRLPFPRLLTHPRSARKGHSVVTTGIGPDLMAAAREASLGMIDEISRRTGLSAEDAYLVASVAGDLKISEVVDAPNWVVSMHLERDILEGAV